MTCDLIGFQSRRDRANFTRYILDRADGIFLPDGRLDALGCLSRADAFPIAIDVDAFRALASEAAPHRLTQRLRAVADGRSVILGVDRMDYSMGLPERLAAIEMLLERLPQWRDRATMVRIAPVIRG